MLTDAWLSARRIVHKVALGLVCCFISTSIQAHHEPSPYEKQLKATMITGVTALNTMFLGGLVPPPYSQVFETGEYVEDLLLKKLEPLLSAPENVGDIFPNTADQCGFRFVLPQSEVEFTNFFGVINFRPPIGGWYDRELAADINIATVADFETCMAGYPEDSSARFLRRKCDLPRNNWGILGAPEHLWHVNSSVVVNVSGSLGYSDPTNGISATDKPQIITIPSGTHELTWTAGTQRDWVMDVSLPPVLILAGVLTEVFWARYGDDILKRLDKGIVETADNAADATRYSRFKQWVRRKAIEFAVTEGPKYGIKVPANITLEVINSWTKITTASTFDRQYVTVFDVFPPSIQVKPDYQSMTLEASSFGGAPSRHYLSQMQDGIIISDECNRLPNLSSDLPGFLRMGETTVTWTAKDQGPNPDDGKDYAPTATQIVKIVDTQPPLVVAPAGLVIETADTVVDRADIDLGAPLVTDLADPEPSIENDAPGVFNVNTRSEVNWSVTDASGNQSSGTQWVTIKPIGENTAPLAQALNETTRTARELDIRLAATDGDFIDGMADPLWFSIVDQPANGQFVAPLLPFFIDDYRTSPVDQLGEGFAEAAALNMAGAWIENNICANQQQPPVDFVHEPLFVQVMDDGTRYILDYFFTCDDDGNDQSHNHLRISKWDEDDIFIAQKVFGPDTEQQPNNDSFLVDDDGFLYFSSITSSGSSSTFSLKQCSTDFEQDGGSCPTSFTFKNDSSPEPYLIDVPNMTTAKMDYLSGVLYLTDRARVYVFRHLNSGGIEFLDILAPSNAVDGKFLESDKALCPTFLNGTNFGFGMEIDSEGSVYIADSCSHKIHKFTRSYFDEAGDFIRGDYIGWLGKCTGGKNCDLGKNKDGVRKNRSYGYRCTLDTCDIDSVDTISGNLTGQFEAPLYLAMDPNDILYVADYENFRVQRFGTDGSYSGEAVSTGTGINNGEEPSFVLGNMSKPRAVSVNSSQFFVVDRDTSFMHIFGTLPFKDISSDSVTVTYVSNNGFHNKTDRFSYQASDGLAQSNVADVLIRVKRNFRPPKGKRWKGTAREDIGLPIVLSGTDPDGATNNQDIDALDTLTFAISKPPKNGVLISTGEPGTGLWTYRADPDYYGPDSFEFTTHDGVFESDPAVIELEVLPVNDPPVLVFGELPRVGRGFPATFVSSFTDDPSGPYTAVQSWGDGSFDIQGEAERNEITDEVSFEPGKAVKIAVSEDGLDGTTSADHVYATLGTKAVSLCLTDAGNLSDCKLVQVEVEDLVALGLEGYSDPELTDAGTIVFFEVELNNQVPEFGSGVVAENLRLEATLGPELGIQSIFSSLGNCQPVVSGSFSCDFANLAVGEAFQISVQARGSADIIYDQFASLDVKATTTSEAVDNTVFTIINAEIIADPTDTDGDGMTDKFESFYGLNPDVDDSGGDEDRDELTNLEEYENRTSPQSSDTDGDDLSDFDEIFVSGTDPLDKDSDADGMPDGWEVKNGTDPLKDDAVGDVDGDGISNLDEYLASLLTAVPVMSRLALILLAMSLLLVALANARVSSNLTKRHQSRGVLSRS